MRKKALEQFKDIENDIKLIAKISIKFNPEATTEELRAIITKEIDTEDAIQQDIQALVQEHLVDVKFSLNEDRELTVTPVDLSKNKIKLQIRANGTERVLNAIVAETPILVRAKKDDKYEFTNEEVIKSLEELVKILKTGKIQEIKEISEDISLSGKDIAELFISNKIAEDEESEVAEDLEIEAEEAEEEVEAEEAEEEVEAEEAEEEVEEKSDEFDEDSEDKA